MTTLDLTPLYRSTIGFDRMASLLDSALRGEQSSGGGYPPYNIEVTGENQYGITLAVAGFEEAELDIQVENGVLSVRGKKADSQDSNDQRRYLHQGIAYRSFERKFNLADHVEVRGAELRNGLLNISLVKEVPEAMKPKSIAINTGSNTLEHQKGEKSKVA